VSASTGSLTLRAADGADLALTGPPDLLDTLRVLWQPFLATETTTPHEVVDLVATDLATTCAEVNRALVARLPWPAVHSGVVALGDGAVAFPAVSGAGKSTLTTALCLAGAGYLSDEALVLEQAGEPDATVQVLPYPKPVALSPWSAGALGLVGAETAHGDLVTGSQDRELLFTPDALGGTATAAPLAHVLLPVRDGSAPALEPLPRREALAMLLKMSFNHYQDPRRFLVVAAAAVQGAQVHRLHVGEPTATARLVVDRLG
jgi:hypothetical protein